MPFAFPEIRVGAPIRHESLAVFPLFAETINEVEYELAERAMSDGTVTVEEVSQSGSVPELAVENKGELRVLFLEGEELVGAKQNRVLNTSLLVAAGTVAKIPVSCVEAGRWRHMSSRFGSAGNHSSTMLRRVLKASVSKSVREKRGHRSDQNEVWEEVARQQTSLGAESGTSAMSDTFETHRKQLDEFRRRLSYVDLAVGAAVAVGNKVLAIDLFDKPTTCSRVWHRLLSGAVMDALEADQAKAIANRADVEQVISAFRDISWESAAQMGEGFEFRAESPAGDHASALVFDDNLVHGSIVCAV